MASSSPWTTWWQTDLPCRFSQADALQNSSFLADVLGADWLARTGSAHPLAAMWKTASGVNAFLLLNALAEDLRLLKSSTGIADVIADLKDGHRCRPTWHVIRLAAMFVRGGAEFVEFFPQTDVKVPDFSFPADGVLLNVEAKLLLESDVERAFNEYASKIEHDIMQEILAEEAVYPSITVVFKDSGKLPSPSEVASTIATLLRGEQRFPTEARGALFNVFVEGPPEGAGLFKRCILLCPRSERENLRVAGRLRNASHQLMSDAASGKPGVACLELTRLQDVSAVIELLRRKFAGGWYPGISWAMLSLSGTHLDAPRRSVADFICCVDNPQARYSVPPNIPLRPLDLCGRLDKLHTGDSGIPAYRVATVTTRNVSGAPACLLPDIRRIQPSWLL